MHAVLFVRVDATPRHHTVHLLAGLAAREEGEVQTPERVNAFYCDHGRLVAEALISNDICPDQPCRSYGWRVLYRRAHDIGLETAEAMRRTLTTIEKGLARQRERLGPCESFGHYVARLAVVVNAAEVIFDIRDFPNPSGRHRSFAPGNAVAVINQACLDLRGRLCRDRRA